MLKRNISNPPHYLCTSHLQCYRSQNKIWVYGATNLEETCPPCIPTSYYNDLLKEWLRYPCHCTKEFPGFTWSACLLPSLPTCLPSPPSLAARHLLLFLVIRAQPSPPILRRPLFSRFFKIRVEQGVLGRGRPPRPPPHFFEGVCACWHCPTNHCIFIPITWQVHVEKSIYYVCS